MTLLATTSSHTHTHICVCMHTHFKSWKCLLLQDLLFAMDLIFMWSYWRKLLQKGNWEVSRPNKVIVFEKAKIMFSPPICNYALCHITCACNTYKEFLRSYIRIISFLFSPSAFPQDFKYTKIKYVSIYTYNNWNNWQNRYLLSIVRKNVFKFHN